MGQNNKYINGVRAAGMIKAAVIGANYHQSGENQKWAPRTVRLEGGSLSHHRRLRQPSRIFSPPGWRGLPKVPRPTAQQWPPERRRALAPLPSRTRVCFRPPWFGARRPILRSAQEQRFWTWQQRGASRAPSGLWAAKHASEATSSCGALHVSRTHQHEAASETLQGAPCRVVQLLL